MRTSNHWNFLLLAFPIIGTFAASGQIITTYDSRPYGAPAVESIYRAVDVGQTNIALNPDYKLKLRSVAVPALWDMRYELGVTITNGIEQAEADLRKLKAWSIPVTPRQFRLALLDIDVTPDNVESLLATIGDEKLRTAAQIEWRNATEIRRDHPLIAQIAPMLGGTDEMLDELFLAAQEIP